MRHLFFSFWSGSEEFKALSRTGGFLWEMVGNVRLKIGLPD